MLQRENPDFAEVDGLRILVHTLARDAMRHGLVREANLVSN